MICFSLVLAIFTTFVALDTFVFKVGYVTNATQINRALFGNEESSSGEELTATQQETEEESTQQSTENSESSSKKHSSKSRKHGSSESSDSSDTSDSSGSAYSGSIFSDGVVSGENTYSDENVKVTLTEYYENNTKIYVADVYVKSAEYLKTAFAEDTYGQNVKDETSSIAKNNNAIFAINGDYYGARKSGYVIRNGILYRDTPSGSDVLCIYADGSMEIFSDSEISAQQLIDKGAWQVFSFGPGLIENGTVTVDENDEVGRAMSSNPRTALGVVENNHFVFVVSDGRTDESEGLTLSQLAQFMKGLGVKTAYNLDGGGSSTMYFNGSVINNPTTSGNSTKERSVSDIVYIG